MTSWTFGFGVWSDSKEVRQLPDLCNSLLPGQWSSQDVTSLQALDQTGFIRLRINTLAIRGGRSL